MEKVTLRHIYIEIGRMCNLSCEHCCKGESEDVEMSDEVMDALLDNVYFIDEITVSGGEPMLYIERIKTLLDKCKSRKIRVNYFNIITNCTMKSEAFVEIFNEWIDYCVFGNRCSILISNDSFHIEQREKYGMAKVDEVASWYSEKIKKCVFRYLGDGATMLDNRENIVLEGRAKNIDKELLKNYCKTSEIIYKPTYDGICQINKKYIGVEIYLNVYGDLYKNTLLSFESQRKDKEICIGNIIDKSIYECILKWNKKCEDSEIMYQFVYDYSNFPDWFLDVMKDAEIAIFEADRCCVNGNYSRAMEFLDLIGKRVMVLIKVLSEVSKPVADLVKYIEEPDSEEEKDNRRLEVDEYGELPEVCHILSDYNKHIKTLVNNIETYRTNIKERIKFDIHGSIKKYPCL